MQQQGMLSIVPTPLGNLGDITVRAERVLNDCDAVYAEDTRVTGKLLSALGISKPLFRLDEHRMAALAEEVVQRVKGGERIAYCSDAGMPGISDPGLRLVRACREAAAPVEVLPGASACTTAFVASAPLSETYFFGGFFPRKPEEQKTLLKELEDLRAALIFYESPRRVAGALKTIARVFPYRSVSVCRELTKLHEEVVSGQSGEIAELFAERERAGAIKGEIVLVIDGPNEQEQAVRAEASLHSAKAHARTLVAEGKSARSVAQELAHTYGISKNDAYTLALEAKAHLDGHEG